MESLFGFGMMAGPLIGGVLYKYGGFCLPFVVIGSTMVVCYITALIIVKPKQKNGPIHCEAGYAIFHVNSRVRVWTLKHWRLVLHIVTRVKVQARVCMK